MREIVFVAAAESDLIEAWDRYEEVSPGLGDAFEAEVGSAVRLAAAFPEIAPVFFAEFRRLLVRRFQYGVFYTIEGRRMVVRAVLDLRADPDTLRRRLR